jgi:uncharacterized protein (TIRG00374 family)
MTEESPTGRKSGGRNLLKGIVVLGVLGFSVWYIVSHTNPDDLGDALATMHPGWAAAGVAATLAAHVARSQRWRILIPDGSSIGLWNAFSATMIGYMMNNLVPRSGEVVRPMVLAGREKRPVASLLATVFVERILDGLTLALIFLLLLFYERSTLDHIFVGYSISGILSAIMIPLALLLLLTIAALKTSLGERLLARVAKLLPKRFGERLLALPGEFRAGIGSQSVGSTIAIILWSILIWLGYALTIYCGFLAFDFDRSYGLGLAATLPMLAVTAVANSIAPTPGAIGVYHAFCIAALAALFAIPEGRAAAFAIVTHAGPYLAVMVTGAVLFFREDIRWPARPRDGGAS